MAGPRIQQKSTVFISYSRADGDALKDLRTYLAPHLHNTAVELWHDAQIQPGVVWHQKIVDTLRRAHAVILLVSPSFLASEYIQKIELPVIEERARTEQVKVLWIPVRPSGYEVTFLHQFQAVIPPDEPLSQMSGSKREQAWVLIAQRVAAVIDVSRIGNMLGWIDRFAAELQSREQGIPAEDALTRQSGTAERVDGTIELREGGMTYEAITAADLEKLPEQAKQLIRSYERSMNDLFDRWTENHPKCTAEDDGVRERACAKQEQIEKMLCKQLRELLEFIESMNKRLTDHYQGVRYICKTQICP